MGRHSTTELNSVHEQLVGIGKLVVMDNLMAPARHRVTSMFAHVFDRLIESAARTGWRSPTPAISGSTRSASADAVQPAQVYMESFQ